MTVRLNCEMDGRSRLVVIINGMGGSGKDTFVKQCEKIVDETIKRGIVTNISTVDTVKDIATKMGYNGGKTEADRLFLSELKRIWDDYNHGCTDDTITKVERVIFYRRTIGNDSLVFVHCREPEKIEYMKNTIREQVSVPVVTLLVDNAQTKKIESNESDKNVNNYDYDFTVLNDYSGLDRLNNLAKTFLTKIGFVH